MIAYEKDAQAIVDRLISILGKNINIINKDGIIIASGDKKRIGHLHEAGRMAALENREITVNNDNINTYPGTKTGVNIPVYYKNDVICVVGITGDVSEVKGYALVVKELVELMFQELENRRFEYLKGRALRSFARELLNHHDSEDITDLIARAKVMDFDFSVERVVIEIDVDNLPSRSNAFEDMDEVMIQNFKQQIDDMLNSILGSSEIAFNLHDHRFIILKQYSENVEDFAYNTIDILKSRFNIQCHVGIGCVCYNLSGYSQSYKLADKAIEIGKKVDTKRKVYPWDKYKLHMLLKSSGTENKNDYLCEYKPILEDMDKNQDMLVTIKTYFEKGMSIKETASELFIHKNTVLYRLNKVKEKYGINIFNVNECMNLYITILLCKI